MEQKCKVGGAAQTLFDAPMIVLRHKLQHSFDRTGEALRCRAGIRMMHEARAQISRVGEVALDELFAWRIEFEELPLCGFLVEPRHARERERRGAARHDHLQSLIQAATTGLL